MEKPYAGRATITNNYGSYKIVIPSKKMWFVALFLGAWLCGWVFGELFALAAIAGFKSSTSGGFGSSFLIFWLCGWTIGGLVALRIFIWMIIGKEVITAEQGRITIHKKGLLFSKAKTYDVHEIKNMRTNLVSINSQVRFSRYNSHRSMNDLMGAGAISFDYGMKTVTFASGIDTAEASHILKTLRSGGQLFERNFENNPHQSGFHNH